MSDSYRIVYEQGPTSWGAYVPDLPGCGAVAKTKAEVEKLIRSAIAMHLDGLARQARRDSPRSRPRRGASPRTRTPA